ncbi:hypothetical protein [Burkholderia sp. MSMB2157WGS]|uniref:hypothetical protein n=1 Tax=Burkholderia sp. MSMB2157WGS TaxID=1637928 RepID=UPI000AA79C83|nr:hypothetical protein [Burkholderia sp. MSMB2157WGS]
MRRSSEHAGLSREQITVLSARWQRRLSHFDARSSGLRRRRGSLMRCRRIRYPTNARCNFFSMIESVERYG